MMCLGMERGGGEVENFLRCVAIEGGAPDRFVWPLRPFFPALRTHTHAALLKGFQVPAGNIEVEIGRIRFRVMKVRVPEGS